jgi:hypothetical protein
MLVATIAAALKTLQTILVARKGPSGGLRFLDYLVLQEGAGFSSLMSIVVWRGKFRMVTRVWSVIRLLTIVLVPILNIVVMSKCSVCTFVANPDLILWSISLMV